MKVFMSTWGWNGGVRAASSDIEGDAAAIAMTIATIKPDKKRILVISANLHGKVDPAPICIHAD